MHNCCCKFPLIQPLFFVDHMYCIYIWQIIAGLIEIHLIFSIIFYIMDENTFCKLCRNHVFITNIMFTTIDQLKLSISSIIFFPVNWRTSIFDATNWRIILVTCTYQLKLPPILTVFSLESHQSIALFSITCRFTLPCAGSADCRTSYTPTCGTKLYASM